METPPSEKLALAVEPEERPSSTTRRGPCSGKVCSAFRLSSCLRLPFNPFQVHGFRDSHSEWYYARPLLILGHTFPVEGHQQIARKKGISWKSGGGSDAGYRSS